MGYNTIILNTIISAVAVLLLLLGVLIYMDKKNKKDKANEIKKVEKQKLNYLDTMYRIYIKIPFLRATYLKLMQQTKILYPSEPRAVTIKTTQIMTKAVVGAISCFTAVLLFTIFCDGDIYYIAAGTYLTYVIFAAMIHQSYVETSNKLINQFGEALDIVIHYYHEKGIMETALECSLDDVQPEIALHLEKIHKIVTSPKMKEKMDEYIGSEPNKIMLLFLYICSSIKEYGDTKLSNGQGLFVTSLGYVKEEINIMKNETLLKEKLFQWHVGLSLAPAILIKPIELTAMKMVPEASFIFKGVYGAVITVGVFLICALCYNFIILLRDGTRELDREHDKWSKWAENKTISPYLNKYLNVHYKEYEKYDELNRAIGDRTGPKAFLLKRVAYAVGLFVLTLMITFTSGVAKRNYLKNDFKDTISISLKDDEKEMMENAAKNVMQYKLEHPNCKVTTLYEVAGKGIDDTVLSSQDYLNIVVKAGEDRYNQYKNTRFMWYSFIIAGILGFGAYMYPVISLKRKKNIAEKRKIDEVMRFQSLLLVLMNIKGMTVPIILEWMEGFANAFKDSIIKCRVSLPQGQMKALENLRFENKDCAPFRSIVDNMISVDKVGIRKAFNEIEEDRKFYVNNRKIQQEATIRSNASWSNKFAMLPLYATIVGCYIIPIGIYAYILFKEMNIM